MAQRSAGDLQSRRAFASIDDDLPGHLAGGRSENTINDASRTMEYTGDEMTGHGFRTVASTIPNESGEFRPDASERQLSHQEDDEVRARTTAQNIAPKRRSRLSAAH
jgi:hypothetical protein